MPEDAGPTDADSLVSDDTKAEEEREAIRQSGAGEGPTPEEEAAAERSKDSAAGVEEPYREMTKLGAEVEGEGQIN